MGLEGYIHVFTYVQDLSILLYIYRETSLIQIFHLPLLKVELGTTENFVPRYTVVLMLGTAVHTRVYHNKGQILIIIYLHYLVTIIILEFEFLVYNLTFLNSPETQYRH